MLNIWIINGSIDGKLEGSLLVVLLWFTGGTVLGSEEGIRIGSTDGKVLGNMLGVVDVESIYK